MADIQHGTLESNQVTTVTLDANYRYVEVLNRSGDAEIYFTVDGPVPSVSGADCFVLPAVISVREVDSRASGITVVRLISTGTPTWTVSGR
jgi:hypothetical protein